MNQNMVYFIVGFAGGFGACVTLAVLVSLARDVRQEIAWDDMVKDMRHAAEQED